MAFPENFTNAGNISGFPGPGGFAEIMKNVPGIESLVKIGQAIGIAVLVYIIFLIIKSISQVKYSMRFKRLVKAVEEINKKMDTLIGKRKGRKEKE